MSDSSLDSNAQRKAAEVLVKIAESEQIVSEEAQSALVKAMSDSSLDSNVRGKAMEALGKIAESGQIGAQKAQSALVKAMSDSSLGSNAQRKAAEALGKIAESGQIGAQKAQSALVNAVSDSSLGSDVRRKALEALGKIVRDLVNRDSCLLVLKICYLTQRALVISKNQISISDRRYRELVPMEDIDIDYLKGMQLKEINMGQLTIGNT